MHLFLCGLWSVERWSGEGGAEDGLVRSESVSRCDQMRHGTTDDEAGGWYGMRGGGGKEEEGSGSAVLQS